MQAIEVINSVDDVSGRTTFDGGIQIYWSGANNPVVLYPDGTRLSLDPFCPNDLLDAMDAATESVEPRMASPEAEAQIAGVFGHNTPAVDLDLHTDPDHGGSRPSPMTIRTFDEFTKLDKAQMYADLVNYRVDRLESKSPEDSAEYVEYERRLAYLARKRFQNVDVLRGKIRSEAAQVYAVGAGAR